MSEDEIVVADAAGRPTPVAPPAASADETTVSAADVESVAGTVDNRPDHLRRYTNVMDAVAAHDELRGHATFEEARAAYHARRADHSQRLMLWMQGES